jgi:hypothetical protein
MSTLSLKLPNSLHEQAQELAQKEGISLNQFVTLAVAEKTAVLTTKVYLQERAKRGSREQLLAILANAPDVEAEEYDQL